jgi:ABC-type sugar transport system ATPase subunit
VSVSAAHLLIDGVSKSFPGVRALKNVCLEAFRGEALALMGANGAGKSTLMNVLGGVVPADSGAIFIDGQSVAIRSPRDAADNGIAFVQQELNVAPSMSVAENVSMTNFPLRAGLIDKPATRARAAALLERLGCAFGADDKVEWLGIGDRQMVEIAAALAREPKIIIFDEPTSSLTNREKRKLFEAIARLKKQDVTILYVTHFLEEIFEICERVAVLRDGATAGAGRIFEFTPGDVVRMMLGTRHSQDRLVPPRKVEGPSRLSVKGLSRKGAIEDVSFSLRPGEVVGLWGLLGSGRTETVRALVGLDPIDAGEIAYDDGGGLKAITPEGLHRHVGFVTEDRRREGLLLSQSVAFNLSLGNLPQLLNRVGAIDRKKEASLVERLIGRLGIKVSGPLQRVGALSGGNQQKVVFGRWLATEPRLFFLDEPTRGLDVGAKNEILALICELAKTGASVLLISSEVEELMRVCDRYLVMSHGRLVAELPGDVPRSALLDAISAAPGAAPRSLQ